MNILINRVLYLLLVVLSLQACKKDIDQFVPDGQDPVQGKMITADLAGTITDEAGEPLPDVAILAGNKQSVTDENGVFIIRDATVNDEHTYVRAQKSGYFNGSRTIFTEPDALHYVTIQLVSKENAGSFSSSSGGAISFEGVVLEFPPDGIAHQDGSPYTGTVNVAANWLDPGSDDILIQMPGNLRGITVTEIEQGLTTYGMMAVELSADDGTILQVADGKEVEMQMPVPASLTSSAPAIIPLWYFNDDTGFWEEEGTAELINGSYVGNVSHFSFWNCDAPFPVVNLRGRLIGSNNNPIPLVTIKITLQNSAGFSGYGQTNQEGRFGGKVPKDEIMVLEIADECRNVIYSQTIGPFSEDVTLPDIVIDPADLQAVEVISVQGRVINCDGEPVANSYVSISTGQNVVTWNDPVVTEDDGTFSADRWVCNFNGDVTATAFDADAAKQSPPVTVSGQTDIDFGDLRACEDLDEYFNYNLDGINYTAIDLEFRVPQGGISVINGYSDSLIYINIAVVGLETGTFPIFPEYLNVNGLTNGINTLQLTFTRYDQNVGGYVEGNISGNFENYRSGSSHSLSGDFRIKRE